MNRSACANEQEISGFIRGQGTELVVLLHAYRLGPESMEWVKKAVCESEHHSGADFYIPPIPASCFSFADPIDIVQKLLVDIDRLDEKYGYLRITMIGHSLGALLARKVYVCACGENEDAPFEPKLDATCQRPWAGKVDRIILLAGMNRGWSISRHMGFGLAFVIWAGVLIGTVLSWFKGRPPLIVAIRRGSPFITQLRIQWLSMLRHPKRPIFPADAASREVLGEVTTIQLLGSVDDLVSPEDNIDLATGGGFIYLDVPRSGHVDVIQMDGSAAGVGRLKVFAEALDGDPAVLKGRSSCPADHQIEPDGRVKNVIFVIHGIRDKGYWTHKLARRVMDCWRKQGGDQRFASVTATYGYYTLLPFLFPWRRREKVRWLMDQYTQALATYPNADFSYIGHSNGTYLLATALEENPSCHFKRVVFAGSVVPSAYDWGSRRTPRTLADGRETPPQIESVLNYVATSDVVVALFPNGLGKLGVSDLGSAGHDGFEDAGAVSQMEYVRGGHGAAIEEAHWDEIARFIADGEVPTATGERFPREQSRWVRLAGSVSWAFWILLPFLLLLIAWIPYQIPALLPIYDPYTSASLQSIAVAAYVWLIMQIFTKF